MARLQCGMCGYVGATAITTVTVVRSALTRRFTLNSCTGCFWSYNAYLEDASIAREETLFDRVLSKGDRHARRAVRSHALAARKEAQSTGDSGLSNERR
jgi:hypothetical protein